MGVGGKPVLRWDRQPGSVTRRKIESLRPESPAWGFCCGFRQRCEGAGAERNNRRYQRQDAVCVDFDRGDSRRFNLWDAAAQVNRTDRFPQWDQDLCLSRGTRLKPGAIGRKKFNRRFEAFGSFFTVDIFRESDLP